MTVAVSDVFRTGILPAENEKPNKPKMLLEYYEKFFPAAEVMEWLGGSKIDKGNLSHPEELKSRLRRDIPEKIDIGPIYNIRPSERKSLLGKGMKPINHELVFDIDMSDYDDTRTCCQGKCVCQKCWKFIALAVKILNESLQDDFGFRKILWVFSGRRGVHCWVFDESARKLNSIERKSIVSYLDLRKNDNNHGREFGSFLQTKIFRRIAPLLEASFLEIAIDEQCLLSSPESRQAFLKSLKNHEIESAMIKMWEMHGNSAKGKDFWQAFNTFILELLGQDEAKRLKYAIIINCVYPRLDVNVSTQTNHLLKCPFSIHPETDKVSVPLDHGTVDNFDLANIPTITRLVHEEAHAINMFQKALELFKSKYDTN